MHLVGATSFVLPVAQSILSHFSLFLKFSLGIASPPGSDGSIKQKSWVTMQNLSQNSGASADSSPWRNIPRRNVVVFLIAVFFTFATIGFVNDMINMGRQVEFKLAVNVVLSGLFAVAYAGAGIRLRGRFWWAFVPIFAAQFFTNGWIARWLPDAPQLVQMAPADVNTLRSRLTFDGIAAIVAVCLGYAGYVYVSVHEGRRHARLRAEKALLESELEAARQVQQVLLPESGKLFPGYAVESVYRPAQQVGGDFFQILPAGDGALFVVFGDVAGKGLPAAMLVSMLVGAIRAASEDSNNPALLLRKLHEVLIGRTSGGFVTALAAHIASNGQVTIANAGHLSPYLDGAEIALPGALPLGVAEGGMYEAVRFELRSGSRLALISDGVVEAQKQSGELLGFDRAKDLSTAPAAAIANAAVQFGQEDDITVVTIERRA